MIPILLVRLEIFLLRELMVTRRQVICVFDEFLSISFHIVSRVSRNSPLASSFSMVQLQTFMVIEQGLLFTSKESSLSRFPSENMELYGIPFGGGIHVLCVGRVTWGVYPLSTFEGSFKVPGGSTRLLYRVSMRGCGESLSGGDFILGFPTCWSYLVCHWRR